MLLREGAGGMSKCRLLHAFFITAAMTLNALGVEGLRRDMGDHQSTELEASQGRRGVVGWYENVHHGKVFFDGNSISEGGYCTLGPPTPLGVPSEIRGILATTGVSAERYDMGACGICLNVTLSNGDSVLAYVNDECKSCDRNDLNLGIVGTNDENATWIAVPCDVTTPVKYLFQASNEYYLKVQPRFTRCPVQSMRVKSLYGWLTGNRTIDNFFQFDGHFEFPLPIELVSDFEETVQDKLQSITYFPRAGMQMAQFLSCTDPDETRSPSSSSPLATQPHGEGRGHDNGNTTSATAQSTTPSTARGDDASTSSSSAAAAAAHGNTSLSARPQSHSKAPSTPTGTEEGGAGARGRRHRDAGIRLRR